MTMDGFRSKFGKATMELVGTAILLFTIQVSVGSGSSLAPLAIGGVLITIVYAGAPVSGAHYNPAISLAVLLRGKMSSHEMFVYWLFQIVGGFLGALIGGIVNGSYVMCSLGADHTSMQAFLAEVVFTFVLCLVVLGVATHSEVENNHYYGAAIGLVVLAGAITVGGISGGAFNPAVALGLVLAKASLPTGYTLGVVLANLIGAMAAAGCFYVVAPSEWDDVDATVGETTNLVV